MAWLCRNLRNIVPFNGFDDQETVLVVTTLHAYSDVLRK
jgi:hypothetical protein